MEELTIKDFVTDLEDILRAHPEDTLGQVLPKVRSSHDPVFIFEKNNFHGLLSPYTVLYKKRLPHDTKLKSALFHPPHITENTGIDELSRHMIANRLYTLPVFDESENILGKITLDDILTSLKDKKDVLNSLAEDIEIKKPIAIHEDSSVRDAYSTLRNKNISRLLLTNNEGVLSGIISRRDLINAFMTPTPKERFSKLTEKGESFSFDDEKVYRQDLPVKNFYKPGVHYVDDRQSKLKILEEVINSDYNSIVIVNGESKPSGILSYRNILEALSRLSPKIEIPILGDRPSGNVNDKDWDKAQELIDKLLQKLNKQIDIQKAEFHVDEPKSPAHHTKSFNAHLKITPIKGKTLFAGAQAIKFIDAVHEVISEISRLERKQKTKQTRKRRRN